ncbi:MAG: FKBP-type peptidyl-prolyl cis-trans isomerase [Lachnospiraceae bacterium]|nr:FKBP-type peptidyl-prolyl cis-trans isomerase [Lachnospiraceae bacterium]
MDQKEKDALSEDVENTDATESTEETDEKEAVNDVEKEEENDIDADDDFETEVKKERETDKEPASPEAIRRGRNIIFFELALAAVAILIIIISIAVRKNNENKENAANDPATAASENAVDNSILFTDIPEVPDFEKNPSINYEALSAENKMLKLSDDEGGTIYVHNYNNREYFLSETSISENDVDDLIRSQILVNYLEEIPVEREIAEMYDSVSINYTGKIDGVAFDGGTAEDQSITLGVDPFIEGFTEGIIGMKIGETKDVVTRFPDSYPQSPDLEGKEAIFTITLNAIEHANRVPELTDEIAAEASQGAYPTAKEAREYFEDQLRTVKIWSFIDTDFYVEKLSKDTVLKYYNASMKQYDKSSTESGISIETMLSMYYGVSVEEFKEEQMRTAAESVQHAALYNAIAAKEGITVSDEDYAKLASDYGYTADNVDEFKAQYGEEIIHDYILQANLLEFFKTIK